MQQKVKIGDIMEKGKKVLMLNKQLIKEKNKKIRNS